MCLADKWDTLKSPGLLLTVVLMASRSFALVIDLGSANVQVRHPHVDTVALAGDELTKHLEMACGTRPDGTGVAFVLGERPSGEPEPKPFESHVKVVDGKVWFWGIDNPLAVEGDERFPDDERSKATLYAVYEFLDRVLGVKWVFPGDDGIVVPPRKSLLLEDGFSLVFRPSFDVARICIGRASKRAFNRALGRAGEMPRDLIPSHADCLRARQDDIAWLARMRLISPNPPRDGHAFGDWQERFLKDHPQWFGLNVEPAWIRPGSDGRGLPDSLAGRSKFCVSNPEVPEAIVADWQARGMPKYFDICPNDGTPGYCHCANCLALDERRDGECFLSHLTDRYVWFWNRIAEKAVRIRPDVKLVSYIYSYYRFPPRRERIEFPDNFVFSVVPSYIDDSLELYKAWQKAGVRHFFLRPNYLCWSAVFPHGLEKFLYDDFHTAVSCGSIGVSYDGGPRQVLEFEYYTVASLAAHPEKSFEVIEKEFCSQFGAAAEEARTYYARARMRAERTRPVYRKFVKGFTNYLDDSQLSTEAVCGQTVAELEGDLAVLRPALEKPLSDGERKRVERLVRQARHALMSRVFIAFGDRPDSHEFKDAARALHEFRLAHKAELGHEYLSIYHTSRSCEIPTWRKTSYLAVGGKK